MIDEELFVSFDECTKIQCHMIFAVKHDRCHKARLVAGEHLTILAIESVYSGAVSIYSICQILLITELNDLEISRRCQKCILRSLYRREDILHC